MALQKTGRNPEKDSIAELRKAYRSHRRVIARRMREFSRLRSAPRKRIFEELCFCLLTPQSSAVVCDGVIKALKSAGLLLKGGEKDLQPFLKKARFYRKKSYYLVRARKVFMCEGQKGICRRIRIEDPKILRDWLVENILGMGFKEAGHFLRNIGLGEDLAILDVHILRRLVEFGVINAFPKSLGRKTYMEIEEKMRQFAGEVGIPLAHLDLLFWCMGTGHVFK